MDMSQPDDDGVYRNGATKRKARTELAMQCLTELWNAACKDVSFPVPDSGIGFAAVGSLARGQLGPSSDLDLVIIYEPRTLNDQQLNELANKLWYPLWDSGLDLDHSIRTRAQCEEVTDHDLPAAMGWLDVKPIAGDTALITTTATSILVLPYMAERQSGTIINISSTASKTAHANASICYGASKAAVNSMTQKLAYEMGPYHIRVNGICPGPIETDMSLQWTKEYRTNVVKKIPLGVLGTTKNVADVAVFLASDMAGFINGETINVNGGSYMN